MSEEKSETARQRYIGILRDSAEEVRKLPQESREGALTGELVQAGYLEGTAIRDVAGAIVGAGTSGITVKGRLFLQELEEHEAVGSPICRSKAFIGFAGGFLLGLFTPILADWLRSFLIS